MRYLTLGVAVAGCARSVPPPFPPGFWNGTPTDGSTPGVTDVTDIPSVTGATGSTGGTGDSGTTMVPFDPDPALEPSVRITGVTGSYFAVHGVSLLPTYGTDPSAIFATVGVYNPYGLPQGVILPGAYPPGHYQFLDVWDGVSAGPGGYAVIAGDVNDDGHLDIWGEGLFHGPFLGRVIDWENDWVAKIDYDGYGASFGDVDVDGDGNEDVVFGLGWGLTADLFYGPFSGEITVPPGPSTRFGDFGCSDGYGVTLLRDHLGPGHHGIAVGTDGDASCPTFLYDLMQPRGAHLHESDALAETNIGGSITPWWNDAGDLDGDGFSDVVYGDVTFGEVWKGPAVGPASANVLVFDVINGHVTYPLGDLNGDGIVELIAFWQDPNLAWLSGVVTLLFSPYADPVDASDGVVLGELGLDTSPWNFGEDHADLDGDGLEDLVDAMPLNLPTTPPELFNAGELHIWYGADLLAAEQARTAGARNGRAR